MFSTFTAAGIIGTASSFATEITPVALVVVGLGVAVGLTGWVIRKLRSAARLPPLRQSLPICCRSWALSRGWLSLSGYWA
jgi:hypothetical protein